MHFLLTNRVPFDGDTFSEIVINNKKGFVNFAAPDQEKLDIFEFDLLRKMMEPIIERRPTAQQCLNHPYFTISLKKNSEGLEILKSEQNQDQNFFWPLHEYNYITPQISAQQSWKIPKDLKDSIYQDIKCENSSIYQESFSEGNNYGPHNQQFNSINTLNSMNSPNKILPKKQIFNQRVLLSPEFHYSANQNINNNYNQEYQFEDSNSKLSPESNPYNYEYVENNIYDTMNNHKISPSRISNFYSQSESPKISEDLFSKTSASSLKNKRKFLHENKFIKQKSLCNEDIITVGEKFKQAGITFKDLAQGMNVSNNINLKGSISQGDNFKKGKVKMNEVGSVRTRLSKFANNEM